MSPDGKFMWTGSEWIPAPPSTGSIKINNDNKFAQLFDELSVENAKQPSQSLSIQDSVIMGGVNQVFNDEDTMASIAESSIIEVKCSEIKIAIRLGDKDKIRLCVNYLAEYCNSNNRLAKVDQLIHASERQKMCEAMIDLVRNIDVYHEKPQSHNIGEYMSHYGKLIEESLLMHNTAISLNSIFEPPTWTKYRLQLHFSDFEYQLDCFAKMIDGFWELVDDFNSREWIYDIIIDIGNMLTEMIHNYLELFHPANLGPEWNMIKLRIKRKLENINIYLRKAKNNRMIISGIIMPSSFLLTIGLWMTLIGEDIPLLGLLAIIIPCIGIFIWGIFIWAQEKSLRDLSKAIIIYAGNFSNEI